LDAALKLVFICLVDIVLPEIVESMHPLQDIIGVLACNRSITSSVTVVGCCKSELCSGDCSPTVSVAFAAYDSLLEEVANRLFPLE
jgi:hypothetical protein